ISDTQAWRHAPCGADPDAQRRQGTMGKPLAVSETHKFGELLDEALTLLERQLVAGLLQEGRQAQLVRDVSEDEGWPPLRTEELKRTDDAGMVDPIREPKFASRA